MFPFLFLEVVYTDLGEFFTLWMLLQFMGQFLICILFIFYTLQLGKQLPILLGFLSGATGKESASAGDIRDTGSIPG